MSVEGIPESDLAGFLGFAIQLVRSAGEITLRYFRTELAVETKSDSSPVTIADRETEAFMKDAIGKAFPAHGILGEESGATTGSDTDFLWTVDPIDGTKSFVAGVPAYTVLLSLLYKNQTQLGVIYQPFSRECMWASVGHGTWLNGSRTRIRSCSALANALLLTTDTTMLLQDYPKAGLSALRGAKMSRTWGDAYGYLLLASGRADAMIDPRMHLWDIAPLKVIVEEAGGVFSDLKGESQLGTSCLAAGPEVYEEILNLFR